MSRVNEEQLMKKSPTALLTWENKCLLYNYQMSHGLCLKVSNAQTELANHLHLPQEDSQVGMKTHKIILMELRTHRENVKKNLH